MESGRRLVLNPSVRVLWRGEQSIQLELGSRAVVVDAATESGDIESGAIETGEESHGASPWLGRLIGELAGDGHYLDRDQGSLSDALLALVAGGFIWPVPGSHPPLPSPPLASPRLASELAGLHARYGARGSDVLDARGRSAVLIHGTGRLAVGVGTLLAAAGVGRVRMQDSGDVHRSDCAPGGLLDSDEGRRFSEAATDALRRAAPEVDSSPAAPGERPDLVLLTGLSPAEVSLRDRLHAQGCTYLAVTSGADDAVVGPLVLPGLTSCLGCADRHRLDRDHAWSALAVQLVTPRRHAPPADVSLTSLAASLTALQALAHLAGDEPPTLGATLELRLPDSRLRRRSWLPHPGCDCGAYSFAATN